METRQFVAWRRVSTFKQNRSGLGLEAQRDIINYFVERENGKLLADYSECYTGTELTGCTELRKAMNHAKKAHATLIIAKSDRFRNCQEALSILDEMGEGNIEFCDIPHTDRFTLTLFFALAEREALLVSIRTKQALAAKRERGELTGGASLKWKESFKLKSIETRKDESMKRGQTKRLRYLESRDVVAFTKILKRVFPDETSADDMREWKWGRINTKHDNRIAVLSLMRDYKDVDNMLFQKWDFTNIESTPMQVKLATFIKTLKESVMLPQPLNT